MVSPGRLVTPRIEGATGWSTSTLTLCDDLKYRIKYEGDPVRFTGVGLVVGLIIDDMCHVCAVVLTKHGLCHLYESLLVNA